MRISISANCPSCGDVQTWNDQIVARVCTENGLGSYLFNCPECGQAVNKNASPRIIELLVGAEVKLIRWSLPVELSEPHFVGPPSRQTTCSISTSSSMPRTTSQNFSKSEDLSNTGRGAEGTAPPPAIILNPKSRVPLD